MGRRWAGQGRTLSNLCINLMHNNPVHTVNSSRSSACLQLIFFFCCLQHPPLCGGNTTFKNTSLIFVVDSNDRDRVSEARDELHCMLNEDELRDAVLLVFAKGNILPNADDCRRCPDKLGLHSIRQRHWFIQSTCATFRRAFTKVLTGCLLTSQTESKVHLT